MLSACSPLGDFTAPGRFVAARRPEPVRGFGFSGAARQATMVADDGRVYRREGGTFRPTGQIPDVMKDPRSGFRSLTTPNGGLGFELDGAAWRVTEAGAIEPLAVPASGGADSYLFRALTDSGDLVADHFASSGAVVTARLRAGATAWEDLTFTEGFQFAEGPFAQTRDGLLIKNERNPANARILSLYGVRLDELTPRKLVDCDREEFDFCNAGPFVAAVVGNTLYVKHLEGRLYRVDGERLEPVLAELPEGYVRADDFHLDAAGNALFVGTRGDAFTFDLMAKPAGAPAQKVAELPNEFCQLGVGGGGEVFAYNIYGRCELAELQRGAE